MNTVFQKPYIMSPWTVKVTVYLVLVEQQCNKCQIFSIQTLFRISSLLHWSLTTMVNEMRHKTDWRLKLLASTAHTMLVSCETTARVLPVPGLDAQPLIITVLIGSETDAGNGRERLQSTNYDGHLPRGWQDKYGMLRIAVSTVNF